MSARDQARYSISTGGQAKYIRQNIIAGVTNDGFTWDLSEIQFEGKNGKTDFIKIWNSGAKDIYVAFDVEKEIIDTTDRSTYNFKMSSVAPFSEISLDQECSKISLKTASGETTDIQIMVQ